MSENMYSRCRFKVLKTKYVNSGEVIYLYTIVLKDVETDLVVAMTEYADHVLYKVPRDISIYASGEDDVYGVCDFLNFLFFDERLVGRVGKRP